MKIHIAVDAFGYPLRLIFAAGQVQEVTQATALIEGHLAEAEIDAIIPPQRPPHKGLAYDEEACQAATASSVSSTGSNTTAAPPPVSRKQRSRCSAPQSL
jgi:hypothetical protein